MSKNVFDRFPPLPNVEVVDESLPIGPDKVFFFSEEDRGFLATKDFSAECPTWRILKDVKKLLSYLEIFYSDNYILDNDRFIFYRMLNAGYISNIPPTFSEWMSHVSI